MNKKVKYKYFNDGYVIIKNFLSYSDLKACRDQMVKSYKKILNKDINYQNIDQILKSHEEKKDWDKMYTAFNHARNSNAFKKISKKLMILGREIFDIKLKSITTGYAIGIKSSNRTS